MEDKKEYQKILQHLHTQLEKAQEHKKNLDPTSIKKRLEDYEQMLQYCTLKRAKNKMKDSEVEFEEW